MDSPQPPVRRAIIDVGTNSVKLLVADVSPEGVAPVWETGEQTRLGRGFYETHLLQPGPIAATARAVARFAKGARKRNAVSVRVIATSAAREATNSGTLQEAIRDAAGLETEVIPGELEARWTFEGVITNAALRNRPLLILDVGGGSTEFILAHDSQVDFQQSFQLGSVRLFERDPPAELPTTKQLEAVRSAVAGFLRHHVMPRMRAVPQGVRMPDLAIGVGGTISILALIRHGRSQFDRDVIEGTRFSREALHELTERLWSLPLAERRQLPGLPPERADVILTGAAIYEGVLETFGIPELGASTRGLRFAAVREAPTKP